MKATVPKSKEDWLKLRLGYINSTESPCLFGLSPYKSLYQLWTEKSEMTYADLEESERMKWGTRLQAPIADGVAMDNKWAVRAIEEYIYDDEIGIGSSFDYGIVDDPDLQPGLIQGVDLELMLFHSILEIKNVGIDSYARGWIVDGDHIEAPAHIEMQVQHQMAVANVSTAYIAALVGGNDVKIIKRERDEEVIAAIEERIVEFWKSIDENTPPQPDFDRDSKFIVDRSRAQEGVSIIADAQVAALVEEYAALGRVESQTKAARDAIKAQIIMQIGEASKIVGQGFTVSCGMTKAGWVEAHARDPYRQFRVNFKNKQEK